MTTIDSADAVVVGAGLAGVTAARRLDEAGADVTVLEARDRVGGRTLTREVDGHALDMGAQWIGPGQHRMHALVAELGVETFPQHDAGATQFRVAGEVREFDHELRSLPPLAAVDFELGVRKLEKLCRQVPLEDPASADRAREWDATTVATWRDERFRTEAARSLFDAAVRAIFTAEPDELSLLFLLFYCHAGGGFERLASVEDGAQQTRLVGGTQQLSVAMAEPLDVRTATPVRRVEHDDAGVTVHADAGDDGTADTRIEADYAVVAVPPTAAGRLDYDPALPVTRDGFCQRAPMGHVVKAVATYDDPFWRPERSGEVVADDDTVGLVFDDSPPDGETGALVAFVLGDAAREWADRPEAERRQVVLDRLAAFFGPRAGEPNSYTDEVWNAGRWSHGCYAAMLPPGVLSRYADARADPVGRLHWAGTETATEGYGYMEGAVASGERAASEVRARLEGT
ncbi:flavin monoamine oxidase family protein [Haloglomus salinum]|uniref:flavin monoamine oxidase family protein n=1 Tax=Haloglomus salinum TaxID=2962673 RepID=UPI0020C9BA9D|nr:flavin monoamine oxidase family protein [Haloglomus salinum]